MANQNLSSELAKDRILSAATDLFSQYGINGVGIRRIAEEAGINHALIIRYFGSKENLITEILHREIAALTVNYPSDTRQRPTIALENIRKMLLRSITTDESTIKLIVRSELDGLAPEQYVSMQDERAANLIAQWIESHQSDPTLPDPKLVSMILIGAVFSLVSIHPWLMTGVGLAEEDYEKTKTDLVDVMVWMIAKTVGLPEKTDSPEE